MFTVTIPKGYNASVALPLAHKQISCIYLPRTDTPLDVFVFGSHDGKTFGPIHRNSSPTEPLKFTTKTHYSIHTFDASDFEGIMYFQLVLNEKASADIAFPLYLKEF